MAYTKYSLTPANNTAAPPDGAPEGMLPSAVNDTMRDMMAQIRDCGDGVRDGTYTMTAPKITGGTITGATINNTTIGATTATTGKFSTLTNSALTSGRVTYAGASGLLSDSANLTFDGTMLSAPVARFGTFSTFGTESLQVAKANGTGAVGSAYQFAINSKTANNRAEMIMTDGSTANAFISYLPNGTAASDRLTFNLQGSDIVTVVGNGNVGIGTSSPSYKLHVRGADATATLVVGNTSEGTQLEVLTYQDDKIVLRSNDTSNVARALAFETGITERMRIDSSGNLLLGTTTHIDSGRFIVSYASGVNNGIIFTTNGTGSQYATIFNNGNGAVGSITTNASATAYNTSSDYRLKENIVPMTGALSKIAQLKPVTYKWKVDGSNSQGFIAHELQEVVPQCVDGEKDAIDKDGKPKYQGVDTSFLVATLVSAIQEQQALIESLTTRLTALENK